MITDLLLDNIDIKDFMQVRGYPMEYIGGATYYLTTCPFCGKEKHCGINPSRKSFGCFKCHTGGDWIKLFQKLLNKSFIEVLEYLKEGVDLRHVNVNYICKVLLEYKEIERDLINRIKPIAMPEGYEPLVNCRVPYLDNGRKFPIPQELVHYYKMGICKVGKYSNRLIICDVDDNNNVIYWVARDISGKVHKRWKLLNPNTEITGIGSSDLLFNYFLAKNYPVGIITEGVFDALHVGFNGLASYGEGLKKTHIYWLLRANFKEIVLLYDPDVSDERLENSATLLSQYFKTKLCKLPYGDPDEWENDKLMEFINKTPLYCPSRLNSFKKELSFEADKSYLRQKHKPYLGVCY